MAETLLFKGTMRGHSGMVTAIATPLDNSDMIVSSSHDKSVLVWHLTKDSPVAADGDSASPADGDSASPADGDSASPADGDSASPADGDSASPADGDSASSAGASASSAGASASSTGASYGVPRRRLTGHSHFVEDVVLSSDAHFALSGSWDGELRLWDLSTGATTRRFVGHSKDVLSVALSVDNRQIISASRDRTIKLWNTLGECKYTIQDADAHTNWVSCVRFSPNTNQPTIVSGSWDRTVKVWNLTNCKLRCTLAGHGGYVNAVAVTPDGSLCASGGKDGVALLWDLAGGERLNSLDTGAIIHALCFNPSRYWLGAATQDAVQIWDLEGNSVVQELRPETPTSKNQMLYCTSLNWSSDGSTLFTGYTDGVIRVWGSSYY